MSKLLGKEKLKNKAAEMASKTREHELQKQLDAAEDNDKRKAAHIAELRRHVATTESNLKSAHKLFMDISDDREEFMDFDRVDKMIDVLHEMEVGANAKKLERAKKKIEKEQKRKANMVLAMLKRKSQMGGGLFGMGGRKDSITSKIWTKERKEQFVEMARRKSSLMEQGLDSSPLKIAPNHGKSLAELGPREGQELELGLELELGREPGLEPGLELGLEPGLEPELE